MNPGIVILAYARTTKTRQENKKKKQKKPLMQNVSSVFK